MNLIHVAHALRALAAALEAPPTESPAAATTTPAPAAAPAPATAPKPRGRPVKGETAPVSSAAPAVGSAPTPAPAATPAPLPASSLTHDAVSADFKAAAVAHGRDFVKGLLKEHGAVTFDKVKDLALFQKQLKAGPQAAGSSPADDLLG